MKDHRVTIAVTSIGIFALLFTLAAIPTPLQAEQPKQEIILGSHLPLSGGHAAIGKEQKWAYETAVADINRAGGVYVAKYGRKLPVRLQIVDDQSSPAIVVSTVQRLIKEEKVDFILSGHSAVFGVIPGCIVAELHKTYYHATACFIPTWLEHNFQRSTLLFFDMEQSASMPFELWRSLPATQRPRYPALIMEETYDALFFRRMITKKAEQHGYAFTMDTTFPEEEADYAAKLDKAKALGVDAILMFASPAHCMAFIRIMKEKDLPIKYFHGWKGTFSVEFGRVMGEDTQYIISDGHWSENYPYKGAKELGERFFNQFGSHSVSVGTYYALAQILWQAIEKAGVLDPMVVRHAVLQNEFDTIMGKINYGLNGVGIYPPLSFQWIDGKQRVVYPFDEAVQKVHLPEKPEEP